MAAVVLRSRKKSAACMRNDLLPSNKAHGTSGIRVSLKDDARHIEIALEHFVSHMVV